jgi:hypothetical protein
MKIRCERVYGFGRLYGAWQQLRGNAGVAGIDQTTVEMFKWRQDELLTLVHEKPKAGSYRFLKYSLYTPPLYSLLAVVPWQIHIYR